VSATLEQLEGNITAIRGNPRHHDKIAEIYRLAGRKYTSDMFHNG